MNANLTPDYFYMLQVDGKIQKSSTNMFFSREDARLVARIRRKDGNAVKILKVYIGSADEVS